MTAAIRRFIKGDGAQDLVEWSMLIALVVLGTASMMWSSSGPTAGVWTAANSALQGLPAATGSTSPADNTTADPNPTTTKRFGDEERDRH